MQAHNGNHQQAEYPVHAVQPAPETAPDSHEELAAVRKQCAIHVSSLTARFETDRARFTARLQAALQRNSQLEAELADAEREGHIWKSRALRDVVSAHVITVL